LDTAIVTQMVLNGLMLTLMYVLVAVGLTLTFGIMHIVNFAHGAIFMLGAYMAYTLVALQGVNYIVALIVAILGIALLGVLIQLFFFRRFQGEVLPGFIISLGLVMIFETSVLLGYGPQTRVFPTQLHGKQVLIGAVITNEKLLVIIVGLICILGLYAFIRFTKAGQAMVAASQDREAAVLQGIDINRTGMLCMALGGGLAAVAGALIGPIFQVQPYMGEPLIMKAFAVVILGGLGSVTGALLGGLILGFVDSVVGTLIDPETATMIAFGMIILVLLVRPTGLLGHE
jgi:branched-subunit amino acid ABC-type transport system permease component